MLILTLIIGITTILEYKYFRRDLSADIEEVNNDGWCKYSKQQIKNVDVGQIYDVDDWH